MTLPIIDHRGSNVGGRSTCGPHRLAAAANCPLQFGLHYVQGLEPNDEPSYRLMGTLGHIVIAHHHAQKLLAPPEWAACPLDMLLNEHALGRPTEIRYALELSNIYPQYDAGRAWQPIAVEYDFKAALGELFDAPPDIADFVISARADLVTLMNGVPAIVDHKSTNPKSARLMEYRDSTEHVWQAETNRRVVSHRLKDWGIDRVDFCIQRFTRRLPIEIDVADVHIPNLVQTNWPRAVTALARLDREWTQRIEAGEKPPPYYHACMTRYGPCDYVKMCHAASMADAIALMEHDFHDGFEV